MMKTNHKDVKFLSILERALKADMYGVNYVKSGEVTEESRFVLVRGRKAMYVPVTKNLIDMLNEALNQK